MSASAYFEWMTCFRECEHMVKDFKNIQVKCKLLEARRKNCTRCLYGLCPLKKEEKKDTWDHGK